MNDTAALPRPPRLTLRFALYAGAALALAGAVSVWVAGRQVTLDEQRAVWTEATHVAERLGRDDLARAALERPAVGDRRAELDELFDREALGPHASAVTLFGRDGRVTYSTDHSLIGTVHPQPAMLGRALAGEPVYGVADAVAGKVIESYVPVRWVLADPTWPSGVLRVSRDYAPVARKIAADVRRQALATLLGLLLLYAALFPILRRVTRTLAARNRSLVESEARWRALTEQASDGIFVLGGDAVVVQANERACRLLGRKPRDVVGRDFGGFVAAEDLARVPLRIDEVAAGEIVLQQRALVRADGSSVAAELSSRMLDDGRILVIARDVSERIELEAERRRALRAEATERLAAGIAHDFDRLIASIAASAEAGLGRVAATAELRRPLETIREASLRGAELTRQLLVFGTRGEAEPQALETVAARERIDERPRAPEASRPAPVEACGTETILVAEDEHVVRAVVREMLEVRGYTVLDAGSGVEALDVVAAHDGPVDLLLTDVVMPDMGGRELADALAPAHVDCSVVFMSGYSDGPPQPGVVFLEKPFTHESLARTVRHTLDTRRAAA